MSSAVPTLDGGSRAEVSNSASEDPWAKAFQSLTPEDQKQFSDPKLGMLEMLKSVRVIPPLIKT